MERGGGGSSSGGGSGLGEDNRCACGRTLQMVGVHVTPTTGGQFELRVAATDSIEFLRRLVSKRLRVPKERICLLYRERHLREGTLEENSIMDGARITLLPSVETGLLTQRPEQSVMQALESLNDGQVNDFLTGKAPLNLTMRLGDHMMLIQLQLSTVSPGGSRKTRLQPTHSHTHTHAHTHNHAHTHAHTHTHSHTHTHAHTHSHSLDHGGAARTSAHSHALTPPYTPHATCSGYSPVHTSHMSSQSSIPASVTINPSQTASSNSTASNSPSSPSSTSSSTSSSPSSASATLHHQHNLLHHYHHHHHSMGCGSPSSPPPPYLATPPHHHHHHHHHHLRPTPGTPTTPTSPTSSSSGSNSSSPTGLGFDGELPVRGCPHRGEETDPRASLDTKALAEASRNLTQTLKQLSSEVLTSKPEQKEDTVTPHEVATASLGSLGGSSSSSNSSTSNSSGSSSSGSSISNSGSNGNGSGCSGSSSSSSGGGSSSNSSSASSSSSGSGGIKKQGAIIESMHHHGKGVYSGTFSGTLNPALQDRQGRPKRDISTIIHILNDLLCATPQYRRHSTNISLSTSTPTTSRSKNSGGIAKRGTQQNAGASTSELHLQDSATHRNSGKSADNAQTMEQDSGDENQAMRTKVEQLRLIMEQRRARRKARRDARTRPYPHTSASWATDTSVPTVVATSSTAPASTTQAMDVDGSKADGTDPATLCELNSETVVA